MRRHLSAALLFSALSLLCIACSEDPVPLSDGGLGGQIGEACDRTSACAPTLVCSGQAKCARVGDPGTADKGEGCASDKNCQVEYVCASYGKCAAPGSGTEGERCKGNEECAKGLRCSAAFKCAKPGSAGTKQVGEICALPTDCALGLVCLDQKCTPISFWPGVSCKADKGSFRAFFKVPRGGKPLAEFYQLPFPNDIRKKNGHVDVSGHPNPGTALPKEYGDIIKEYITRINADVEGWGVNTAVLMRLSATPDLKTLTVSGASPTIQFFNIDKRSKAYGAGVGLYMFASTGRGKYICENWIGVRPTVGVPLQPLTTYALLLRKGVKNTDGKEAVQDEDFKAMIADTEPTDADLKAAYAAYKPLRDYIADKKIDKATLLSAAVFTTMDPRKKMAKFRDVVRGGTRPAATLEKLTLCDGAAKSPCENGKDATHVCPKKVDAAFDELQGTYKTPVFQNGKPPYKSIADGGNIAYDKSGNPVIQRDEDACVAISVPKGGPMPASGWPVVIFAHGTGGSYRSFINNGTAGALADIRQPGGKQVSRMAVISIDGSMHGPRRGSQDKPDELFFNLRNPAAARDNTYQGVADKYQLVRVIEALNVGASTSPTKKAIKFDTSKIYFFGHSQGAIEGTPFVAYEPQVKSVVLSGAGGYLISSLLGKTKPINVKAVVQFVLADGQLGTTHPLLNLLQLYFEEIDTLNYGKAVYAAPVQGQKAKHLFFSYGVADSFTPRGTIHALARVMGIQMVNQSAERCGDGVCGGQETCNSCSQDCKDKNNCGPLAPPFSTIDPPLTGNVNTPSGKVTAALVPYSSDGSYDDHHVLFKNQHGRAQSSHFLGSSARDSLPTIPKQ